MLVCRLGSCMPGRTNLLVTKVCIESLMNRRNQASHIAVIMSLKYYLSYNRRNVRELYRFTCRCTMITMADRESIVANNDKHIKRYRTNMPMILVHKSMCVYVICTYAHMCASINRSNKNISKSLI